MFTAGLREEMRAELRALDDALPGLPWLRITDRKSGAIQLTALEAQPEPRNLRCLKKAVRDRWGQVPLIDMVTEAALRTGMLGELTAVASREALQRSVLWERLLLVAYAYGTNTGYLRDRDPQGEIEEGLNVVESWNRINSVIFFGKSGEFATNRRDQQQLGMLALHILQAALVYVNTLMLQDILAEPEWQSVLTAEDRRGLTALFWAHVRPYGEITLNMTNRLAISDTRSPDESPPSFA